MSSGKFSFPQNDLNISPLSKKCPTNLRSLKVSLGAIGYNCEYDRELVASILKDVILKFVSPINFITTFQIESNKKGKEVILDLKVGILHAYPSGELQFEERAADVTLDEMKKNSKYIARGDTDMTEVNLERMARAMTADSNSVYLKSAFQSIKTPATQKSLES